MQTCSALIVTSHTQKSRHVSLVPSGDRPACHPSCSHTTRQGQAHIFPSEGPGGCLCCHQCRESSLHREQVGRETVQVAHRSVASAGRHMQRRQWQPCAVQGSYTSQMQHRSPGYRSGSQSDAGRNLQLSLTFPCHGHFASRSPEAEQRPLIHCRVLLVLQATLVV